MSETATPSSSPEYFGQGGRLEASAAEALIASAYRHDCADADILLPGLHDADLAHAIALIEAGVIPSAVAKSLMRGLIEVGNIPTKDFPVRPELGDVYNSKEAVLKAKLGDVAGWIHAGRARREAVNIAYLLAVRSRVLSLMDAHGSMALAALNTAEENIHTLMPDFTYLQHAHPTSFGHYLLTFVYPILRDMERLQHAFGVFNASVAGSGSVNGSRLPIDRARLSELLGCDSVATHTRDAMWQPDIPIELMAAITALLVNIDRLAEELQIWFTAEFDFAGFSDDLARASIIMPQKKNPYGLAYIRGLTGSMLGKTASFAAVGKTYSGNPDSRVFIYGELPRALDRTTEAVVLFHSILRGLTLNKDVMDRRASEGFPQATDLAELIMTHCKLDYRTAHQIVGKIVRSTLEKRIPSMHVTREMVNEAAVQVTGTPLDLPAEQLADALDPMKIVQSRQGVGGAAPERMAEMIVECRNRIAADLSWAGAARARLTKSRDALLAHAAQLASL